MKATEQYFPVVLFIVLYKVVQTFESVDEIFKCNLSNESCWTLLLVSMVLFIINHAVQGWCQLTCGWNPN